MAECATEWPANGGRFGTGWIDDLMIAGLIATEIVGYFDPTPVSDVLNAGLNAADGNYVDAALSLAGAVIPGGGDKAMKVGGKAGGGIAQGFGDMASKANKAIHCQTQNPILRKAGELLGRCFVGETFVVVDFAPHGLASAAGTVAFVGATPQALDDAASESSTWPWDRAAEAAGAVLLVGAVFAGLRRRRRKASPLDRASADNLFAGWYDDDHRDWPGDQDRGILPALREHDEDVFASLVESRREGKSGMSTITNAGSQRETRGSSGAFAIAESSSRTNLTARRSTSREPASWEPTLLESTPWESTLPDPDEQPASAIGDPRPGTPGRGQGEGRTRDRVARDRQAQAKQRTSRRARALPRLDSGVWTIAATAILGLSLAIIGLLGVPSQTLGPQAARQAEPTSNVTTPVIAAAPEKSSADTPSLDERYSGRSLGLRQEGRYVGVSIRDLPVATWILATNPETPGNAGFDYGQVDPAELRIVRLRLEKPDGGLLHIDKLAFAARLSADGLAQGAWMYVEYEELGIANYGEIREIRRCPPIPPRPSPDHCLVTAKFEHSAGDLLNLHVAGLDESLGVTPNHPIWSEDRQQFLRADELDHGEMLRTAHDQLIRVASLAPARESAAVYNLEVDGEHVYYVSPIGILVHNSKGDGYLAPNSLPNINKAVNSNIAHAAERAVERGVFPDKKPAADALRELSKKLTANGLPPGTIPDPKRADSVLVPFGNGWAVYELKANGTAILRTVLGAN